MCTKAAKKIEKKLLFLGATERNEMEIISYVDVEYDEHDDIYLCVDRFILNELEMHELKRYREIYTIDAESLEVEVTTTVNVRQEALVAELHASLCVNGDLSGYSLLTSHAPSLLDRAYLTELTGIPFISEEEALKLDELTDELFIEKDCYEKDCDECEYYDECENVDEPCLDCESCEFLSECIEDGDVVEITEEIVDEIESAILDIFLKHKK